MSWTWRIYDNQLTKEGYEEWRGAWEKEGSDLKGKSNIWYDKTARQWLVQVCYNFKIHREVVRDIEHGKLVAEQVVQREDLERQGDQRTDPSKIA